MKRRWFLPEAPDLLGDLSHQGEVTIAGIEAFAAWSRGDSSKGTEVHVREHEADVICRELTFAIKDAFVTAIDPEDIYEISERLDKILNASKNLVREAELLMMDPDPEMAQMAEMALAGVRDLVRAFPHLAADRDVATACADDAVHQQREIEHIYRRAMSALLEVNDIHEVTGRRELYRRYVRIGDAIEGVAHRIWYAVVKEA